MTGRRVVAVLAIVFFALPLGLRAAGVKARPFENRALAPPPSADAGWEFFDETTRFFVDRMPLREQAVRAYSWTAQHMLDTSPSWRRELLAGEPLTAAQPQLKDPQTPAATDPASGDTRVASSPVLRGSDGWLYVADELGRACTRATPWPVVVKRLEAIARLIRRSGRPVAIVIAPDKSTIYPEHIDTKAAAELWRCAQAGRDKLWSLLKKTREPSLLGLRDDLLRAKRTTRDVLYHRQDTHWNYVGASVAVPPILERLGTVRARPGEIAPGPEQEYTGDLTVLLGTSETDTTPSRVVRRRAGAPVLPGTTLLLQDSFGNALKPILAPYAKTLATGLWVNLGVDQMWDMINKADSVVLQIVERELNPPLSDAARFTLLLDMLRAKPLPRPAG
jgi:hypothetical protein